MAYAKCIDEIKRRIIDIMEVGRASTNPLPESSLEKIALNYRQVFEFVIHACQVTHSHKLNKASKSWNLKDVETLVKKHNSDYFMKAVTATKEKIDNRSDRPTLTLEDLKSGYETTGPWLHATNPFGRSRDPDQARSEFQRWFPLINNLLEAHIVQIDDSHFLYSCLNAGGTMKTHVSFFEKLDRQP